jgi:hypothetical protein
LTVNEALIEPVAETMQVAGDPVTGDPVRHGYVPASLAAKPVPETATTTPTTADVGLNVIVGAAWTPFRNAVSADTNSAMTSMSSVTA